MPKVSILVPARNEEEALPAALDSIFKLEYPDYEVILVDDDSTDRTRSIAEAWAQRPESAGRLKVIHNPELPPGWRGKVHALSMAASVASGKWILATDADVTFHPAVLRLALSCALQKNVEFLSLTPQFEVRSYWEKVVLPAFSLLLGTLYPLRLVNRPGFPRAIAAGAFILMRREDLEALGGYKRLRHSLVEDLRLAELFKFNGRRIYLAVSRGLLRTRMYRDWREMWEGLARSAFEGSGFSVAKVLAGVVVGMAVAVLPWIAAVGLALLDIWAGRPLVEDRVLLLASAVCSVSCLIYLPFIIFLGVSPAYVFTLPLAAVFYSGVSLDSILLSAAGPGVSWKGRRYRRLL